MLSHGGYSILLQLPQLTLLMASQHVQKLSCSSLGEGVTAWRFAKKGPLLWTETRNKPLYPTGATLERLCLNSLSFIVSLSVFLFYPEFKDFLIKAVIKKQTKKNKTVKAGTKSSFSCHHPLHRRDRLDGLNMPLLNEKRAKNNYPLIFNTMIYPFEKPSRLP